jgi:hypothetical protein
VKHWRNIQDRGLIRCTIRCTYRPLLTPPNLRLCSCFPPVSALTSLVVDSHTLQHVCPLTLHTRPGLRRIRLHKSVELEKKGFKWSAGLSVDDVWSASLHAQAMPSTPSCHVELIHMTGR